jgi:hypothetical protein
MARFVREIKYNFSPCNYYPTDRALFGKNDPTKVLARADARCFALKLEEGESPSGAIAHLAIRFSSVHPIRKCGGLPPPSQAEARFGASSKSQFVSPAMLPLAFDSSAPKLGRHQMPKVQ